MMTAQVCRHMAVRSRGSPLRVTWSRREASPNISIRWSVAEPGQFAYPLSRAGGLVFSPLRSGCHWELWAPPPATEGDVVNDRLDGWKAVAAHVRKSVRTAQRWERELGLPVRRMPTENGEIVYAVTSEIDDWARDRERSPRSPKPGGDVPKTAPVAPPIETFDRFAYARGPQMVPSILIPLSPTPRLVPWLAGGGMLLVGTILGWLLGHVSFN